MKPTSIIFLIVSVVLISAGLATCFVATNMAEADGISLYDHTLDENKNSIYTSDISEKGIIKIAINVSNCNVNIIGNAETSKIELVNFTEGMYSLIKNSTSITLDETPNITGMLKFWETGFNFKGMRYLINLASTQSLDFKKEKSVNVYLAEGESVNVMNIIVDKGDVNVDSLLSATDYNINAESGTVSFLSMRTNSHIVIKGLECNLTVDQSNIESIEISGTKSDINIDNKSHISSLKIEEKECDVNINQSRISSFNSEIDSGNIICNTLTFTNFDMSLDSGSIFVESALELKIYNTKLISTRGEILYNGEQIYGSYNSDIENSSRSLTINTKSADIIVTQKAVSDVTDTETDSEE